MKEFDLIYNMSSPDTQQTIQCASCGYAVDGKYCSKCGEKVLKAEDKRIGHFFEEFIHGLTHADSKFLKSLKYLFTKPGFLTVEYLSGRRKGYTSPLSLFLIANLLYFLVPMVDALDSHYITQTRGQVYSASIESYGAQKMKARNWTEKQLEEHYDTKSSKISKLLIILLIFLFSIPVSILFYDRKKYYFDHLIYATEFVTFMILGTFFILPLAIILGMYIISFIEGRAVSFSGGSMPVLALLMLILYTHLAISAKRVYREPGLFIFAKAIGLALGIAACVIVYRYILFYLTMWMI